MDNIEIHFEKMQSFLQKMDLKKNCQFAAWCCYALSAEERIKDHLNQLTNAKENYQLCDAIIKAGWYDYSLINIRESEKAIANINWDSEDSLNDAVETQGVIELLTSIGNMLLGLKRGTKSYYFAACAENLINWKDALANFPYSENGEIEKESLKREYEIQLMFLADLEKGIIKSQDIKKYR